MDKTVMRAREGREECIVFVLIEKKGDGKKPKGHNKGCISTVFISGSK